MSLLWSEPCSVFAQRAYSEGRGVAVSVRITACFIPLSHQQTCTYLTWDRHQHNKLLHEFDFGVTLGTFLRP